MHKINFLLIALLVWMIPCAFANPGTITHQYQIGAILPLSGGAASYGEAAQNGMLMAFDSLSAAERARVKILFEDDGLSATRSVSAFRKLVNVDKADAVVCWSSGTCSAIAPIAETAKIPLIAIASDSKISAGRNFVVNFWVTPEEESKLLIPEALRRGYKRIAIISATHDGAIAFRDTFRKHNHGQIEILFDEEYAPDMKDFRSVAARVGALKNLDAIMMNLLPGQSGVAAKQLRQIGVRTPIFGYETLEDRAEVEASEGALVGSWFVTGATGEQTFLAKYRERFPKAATVTVNNCFDAVMLLSHAAQTDQSSAHVAKFLQTVQNFSGASGTFSATGDNRFSLPATLKYITKDGFEELPKAKL
jgi:branched-chain amino acid transport system substrate-binding protein